MFANLNILTDEECATLNKQLIEKNPEDDQNWNKDYEICTGKKQEFPSRPVITIRKRKGKRTRRKEMTKAKKCW